jgi:hypothetical protein
MPNLFHGFELDITLQAILLAFGLAVFFGVLVCTRCPHCGWLEWVSDRKRDDEED